MSLISLRLHITALLLSLLVVACGGGKGSSAPPPPDFAVAEGNGQVTITWTATPGVDYWLMYAATATPINMKSPPGGHVWISGVHSPLVLSGLVNGQAYSFAMDARIDGGPGGAQTASYTKTPRLGGTGWTAGTGLDIGNAFKGVTYGLASGTTPDFIAVGASGAIYKSTDGAAWTNTNPVWATASGSAVDFNAAIYALDQYITVGTNNGATSSIFHSTDLSNWTASTTPVAGNLNALASDGSTVVSVGDGGKLWWSTDGAIWTEGTGSGTLVTSPLYGVAYLASSSWAAVGQGGVLLTSVDGKVWTPNTAATLTTAVGSNTLRSIAAAGRTWVIVGDAGTIASSADSGLTWTDHSVVGGPTFFAANSSITTYANTPQFLVVGALGAAYTSPDGLTWTPQTTGVVGTLYGLWGSATLYLAVGAGGASVMSK